MVNAVTGDVLLPEPTKSSLLARKNLAKRVKKLFRDGAKVVENRIRLIF